MEAMSTPGPGTRKAHGLAGLLGQTGVAEPRGARLSQTATPVWPSRPNSGSETAFPGAITKQNARAAQHRPRAKRRARPGLPVVPAKVGHVYFRTCFTEGSRTRRAARAKLFPGATTGGAVPGRGIA